MASRKFTSATLPSENSHRQFAAENSTAARLRLRKICPRQKRFRQIRLSANLLCEDRSSQIRAPAAAPRAGRFLPIRILFQIAPAGQLSQICPRKNPLRSGRPRPAFLLAKTIVASDFFHVFHWLNLLPSFSAHSGFFLSFCKPSILRSYRTRKRFMPLPAVICPLCYSAFVKNFLVAPS